MKTSTYLILSGLQRKGQPKPAIKESWSVYFNFSKYSGFEERNKSCKDCKDNLIQIEHHCYSLEVFPPPEDQLDWLLLPTA